MALTIAFAEFNAQTISTTEYSLYNNSTVIATRTDDGIFSLFLDTANMAAGDEYEVALQEKATASSTQRRVVLASLVGAQAELLFVTAAWELGHGWDFTLKKIAGTDRAFSWSIRAVV